MAHIERYKFRADGFRHEEYEQEAMEKVVSGWSESISPDIVSGPAKRTADHWAVQSCQSSTRKLESIIIDKVNFDKLDIATVIQYLQQKSKELDPDHQGINFVLRLTTDTTATPEGGAAAPAPAAAPAGGTDTTTPASPAHPIHREVSITLTDVPLSDILGYVIAQTNLQYTVEDYAVYLRPSIDEGETLTVRTYLVPPNFFQGSSLRVSIAAPGGDSSQTSTVESIGTDVQQALINKGIRFPAGATATFLPGSSKLVVRDTPEQLDLIANLIDQLGQETPQVQIEAKLAEFNQHALKEFTFNYLVGSGVGIFNSFGANTVLRTAGNTGTGLPVGSGIAPSGGPGGLNPSGIDELIQANAVAEAASGTATAFPFTGTTPISINAPNTLAVGAIIDNTGLAMIINAINNLQGVSLLSAPTVTTQNGLKANIDIVREFPYPTSFDKPKLSNASNLAYSSGPGSGNGLGLGQAPLELAIPPTPREFVTQDVGVSLEVKPTTYPDQRIDLDITKCQVLDFDGFINYGVPITTATNALAGAQTISVGVINQPVFNLRSMVTNLQVLDGQTAVLGGLTREDTQEINDKVPGLGDLPLIGRMFQSKVSDRQKKDLVFFITAHLIRSNGKPQYVKTLDAEQVEEALPEPDQQIGPGVSQPEAPESTPNS